MISRMPNRDPKPTTANIIRPSRRVRLLQKSSKVARVLSRQSFPSRNDSPADGKVVRLLGTCALLPRPPPRHVWRFAIRGSALQPETVADVPLGVPGDDPGKD